MSEHLTPFFGDLAPARRERFALIDVHTAPGRPDDERGPAVIFVHGGPVPAERRPRPRDSEVFLGYGSLAAAQGLVGITLDHRLHTDMHYPQSADDVLDAVEQTRALDVVDPDRVALWFFSGGGPLAAEWLRADAPWLRAVAFTYPVLAPPPDWPGDGPRFDALAAASAASVPMVLTRVGGEIPELVENQEAFVAAVAAAGGSLDVLELPDAAHGFEIHGYDERARAAVDRAMSRVVAAVTA